MSEDLSAAETPVAPAAPEPPAPQGSGLKPPASRPGRPWGWLQRGVQALFFILFLVLLCGTESGSRRAAEESAAPAAPAATGAPAATSAPAAETEGEAGSRLRGPGWLPADLFPRLSPLNAATAMAAARSLIGRFWPALFLIVLTVLCGRAFCSWICPLGTTLDLTDQLFARRRRRGEAPPRFYDGRRFKYYLLAALLALAFLGLNLAGWFDPLALVTRVYTTVILPALAWLLFGLFSPNGTIGRFLADRVFEPETRPSLGAFMMGLLFLVFVVGGGIFYRRYWCRNLCPLGALLALLGEYAPIRRRVRQSACLGCGVCDRECRMGALPAEAGGAATLAGECLLCPDCLDVCPKEAVSFLPRAAPPAPATLVPALPSTSPSATAATTVAALPAPEAPAAIPVPLDLTRRGFLLSVATGVVAAPLLRLDAAAGALAGSERQYLIRPPGVTDEEAFLARCVRCGECVKACPTGGLQPDWSLGGIGGLWAARLAPRIGCCEYTCNLCGQVCPSEAIPELSPEAKKQAVLGQSYFDTTRCIPWKPFAPFLGALARVGPEGKLPEDFSSGLPAGLAWSNEFNCGTCQEVCTSVTGAIRVLTVETAPGVEARLPYVIEDLCVGCGKCESVCPVPGQAAIRVVGRPGRLDPARVARYPEATD